MTQDGLSNLADWLNRQSEKAVRAAHGDAHDFELGRATGYADALGAIRLLAMGEELADD